MGQSNTTRIKSWLTQAESGRVEAQYQLGLILSTGKGGTPVDYVTAHKWLNLAAMRGSADAKRLRVELAHDMSQEEIAEAQRLAREWICAQDVGAAMQASA